jgi:hypothetical protein
MAINFDFASIKQRVIDRLRAKVSWSDILYISTNTRLIDAFSEELAYCLLYDEYLARERKWLLASNRSSLLSFQDIFKYKAHRKIGATGILRLSLIDTYFNSAYDWVSTTTYQIDELVSYNNKYYKALVITTGNTPDTNPLKWKRLISSPIIYNIDIPKFTIFSTSGGKMYTVLNSYALTTADDYIDVTITQGIPRSYNFTAAGDINEEFLIINTAIENTFTESYVNSVLYDEISDILLGTTEELVYEVENKLDFSGIYLKFGSDINGKKLSVGDAVIFNYIETLGFDGNIGSSGYITTIDSTIYDSNGDEIKLKCYNQDRIEGGKNEEDIESIRINAPNSFQAGDRATSKTDYKTIIENFPFVLKANVWGAYEVNIDAGNSPWDFIPTEENLVHTAIISSTSQNLTTAQKLLVSAYISDFQSPTDILTFETVEFVNLIFNTVAYINNRSYTLSEVNSAIKIKLADTYSVTALNFFQPIRFSDYQRLIDEVPGVDYHDTTVTLYKNYIFNSSFEFTLDLPVYPILPGSIQVYVQDIVLNDDEFLMATDDGSNSWTGETGYTGVTGSISYVSGVGLFYLNSTLPETYSNYQITVKYKLSGNNLVLITRYSIFKIDNTKTVVNCYYE